jgi:hypothetical protein
MIVPTHSYISSLKRADEDLHFAYLRLSYHPPLNFESLLLAILMEAYADERGALMGEALSQPLMQRDTSICASLLHLLALQQWLLRIIRRPQMDLQSP